MRAKFKQKRHRICECVTLVETTLSMIWRFLLIMASSVRTSGQSKRIRTLWKRRGNQSRTRIWEILGCSKVISLTFWKNSKGSLTLFTMMLAARFLPRCKWHWSLLGTCFFTISWHHQEPLSPTFHFRLNLRIMQMLSPPMKKETTLSCWHKNIYNTGC